MALSASSSKYFGEKKVKSLWEQICDEHAAQREEFEERDFDDNESIATDITQFSATRHTPIVYGKMVHQPHIDANISTEFDPSVGHPAAIGLTMLTKPPRPPSPPSSPLPEPKKCSPREYLEAYVFPTLMPAIVEMLKQAKASRCFERKRTAFNGLDFLTEYLYKQNPQKASIEREDTALFDIPFVKSWLVDHPREPLPLSLIWSEEEAATKIQAFYRGHQIRIRPDVAELRAWQREYRNEGEDIRQKVADFWEEAETRASEDGGSKRASRRSSIKHVN